MSDLDSSLRSVREELDRQQTQRRYVAEQLAKLDADIARLTPRQQELEALVDLQNALGGLIGLQEEFMVWLDSHGLRADFLAWLDARRQGPLPV